MFARLARRLMDPASASASSTRLTPHGNSRVSARNAMRKEPWAGVIVATANTAPHVGDARATGAERTHYVPPADCVNPFAWALPSARTARTSSCTSTDEILVAGRCRDDGSRVSLPEAKGASSREATPNRTLEPRRDCVGVDRFRDRILLDEAVRQQTRLRGLAINASCWRSRPWSPGASRGRSHCQANPRAGPYAAPL